MEFAVACPLLIILLGGAADYGLAQYYRANLAAAMEVGAEYAYQTGPSVVTTSIHNVITDAMNLPAGASVNLTPTFTPSTGPGYYCVTVTAGVPTLTPESSTATCSDGAPTGSAQTPAGMYLTIQETYTNTGLMHGFLATLSQPITDMVVVRVK